ncbi:MAG: VWA domain-containing protein [Candidatus Thiosymbion ectosymbiont of Robbea hypermnestra]|nr:VWA domain-containing protein [Candidatus Thiosymbion ectosymbiont of Robbea hypermnestra]
MTASLTAWEFRDPLFLLAGLAAPLVYFLANRLPARITYASLALPDRAPAALRVRLAPLPAGLLALATLALAIALAGPRTGDETTEIQREGIAIVMALDRSGSMDARDFVAADYSVSRLQALKGIFREFVSGGEAGPGRPDDLIGLVVFGTYADGVCPLTLDHGNLLHILDRIEVARERSESATAVGEGLGLAVERLLDAEARSRVVILLTDGVNNAGELDPLQAAELAAEHGIKVYTIGAGGNGYAPVPVTGSDGRQYLRRALVEMDEKTLREIARRTGGAYFHAQDAKGLTETYRAIDRLERTKITESRYLRYREHYAGFALAALVLIALAGLTAGTLLRRLP